MADKGWLFVLTESFDAPAIERLQAVGRVVVLEAYDAQTVMAAIADCDALLVRTYTQVSRSVIERAARLRVIGRGGVGLDNIDLAAAAERGITVVHTPAAATEAVAELTIGLLIGLVRQIPAGDAAVRAGRFPQARRSANARELSELTLGIIGMGRIGKAVASRCRRGFGTPIVYNDIVAPGWMDFAATPLSKEELYRSADVVSLHVPLTDGTRGLINETTLRMFKPGALLINTSRGAVVDHEALAGALADGTIAGAALDVYDPEPMPPDHPLMKAPNTLFSPHIGARTTRGLRRMNDVVDDVIRVLEGDAPLCSADIPRGW